MDIDGDGKADLICRYHFQNGHHMAKLSNGDGTFKDLGHGYENVSSARDCAEKRQKEYKFPSSRGLGAYWFGPWEMRPNINVGNG